MFIWSIFFLDLVALLFDSVFFLVLHYFDIFPDGYRVCPVSAGPDAAAFDRIVVTRIHFVPLLFFDFIDSECSGDAGANVRGFGEHLIVSTGRIEDMTVSVKTESQ